MIVRRIFNLLRLYIVQLKYKHNQNFIPTRQECLAVLSIVNPNVFTDYDPNKWSQSKLEVVFPHLDQCNERIRKFIAAIDSSKAISGHDVPDLKTPVDFDAMLVSRGGFHLSPVAAVTDFKQLSTELCTRLTDAELTSHGEAAHYLRILSPVLMDIRNISILIIKEGHQS